MKKILIILLAISPVWLQAQTNIDRSKVPEPAPAPEINVGKPATYTLANGLRVYVVQNNKLPRVSATLAIDLDGLVEGDKAGMSSMAGSLLRRGTTKMDKAALDEAIDFLGASISTSSTTANASSLTRNFPRTMELLSEVVLSPSYPAEELEKIRKQELSALQANQSDPAAISQNVVQKLAYGKDHPYGEIVTQQSLNNVTVADIRKYFNAYWKPNNAYLIFVGDITPEEAKKLAEKNFDSWKRGEVPAEKFEDPKAPAQTIIALVDRPASVQSVITFITPVQLKPGAPEAIPSSVMNNILGGGFSGRLFANLREKHGFTYGAYSSLSPNRLVGSFTANASVRNEKTDSAIGQFLSEFNRIRKEEIPIDEVSRMKNYLSGSFARSLENPATIANFALNIARNKLPQNYYQDYLKNLSSVTPATVKQMAGKFVLPGQMYIVVVGNVKEIANGLEKYGQVKYFDIYGNETSAPVVQQVSANVTAETILAKAVEAAGGEAAIAAVKDITLKGALSIMGQNIDLEQKHVFPSAYTLTVSMGGMVIQKEVINNGKVSVMQQGADVPVDEKKMEELMEKAAFFGDKYYLSQKDYKFNVTGIEPVNGKEAYVMQVTTPEGRSVTNYYDKNSGLMIKSASEQDAGPMGKIMVQTYFNDYKTYNGVQIPTKIMVDMGQLQQEVNFTEVKVNSGLKAEDLK
ncbi:MAG: insulinase family protein [Chitinophagaceae bacterium]|jgi:predicted Zn-dependent peptidase|nr:insulinase family protein [Chitinophagaceae bacterium]